jgi:hypothetical protein
MAKLDNIFAIDFDAVIRAIAEANANLVERHHRLMDAVKRVPPQLETDDEIERAQRFAEQLKKDASLCAKARREDTKPLRDLVKKVEAFFKTMEGQSKRARDDVLAALSDAGRRRAAAAASAADHQPAPPADPTGHTPQPDGAKLSETVMINRETGEVLGTATRAPSAPPPSAVEIPMVWEVAAVDRDSLDLEQLRPLFTDGELMLAAKRHLKEKGPHTLRGVTYEQRAAR